MRERAALSNGADREGVSPRFERGFLGGFRFGIDIFGTLEACRGVAPLAGPVRARNPLF